MNKNALLSVLFFALSTGSVCAAPQHKVEMPTRAQCKALVKKLYSSYAASLVLSGCVGATTGAVTRYLEKKLNVEASPIALFIMLFGWALESEFRNDLIAGLQQDLDAYQIAHKKGLMFKGAWIASWLAYLQA